MPFTFIYLQRYHGIKPLAQRRVVSELKEGCLELDEIISTFHSVAKCPYCSTDIASIADLKQHVLQCTQRDEVLPLPSPHDCPRLGDFDGVLNISCIIFLIPFRILILVETIEALNSIKFQRPMLGCSFCPKEKFHFIYDFSAHLKVTLRTNS